MSGTHPVTTTSPYGLGGPLDRQTTNIEAARMRGQHDLADALIRARADINNAFGKTLPVYVPTRRDAHGRIVFIKKGN